MWFYNVEQFWTSIVAEIIILPSRELLIHFSIKGGAKARTFTICIIQRIFLFHAIEPILLTK